MSLKPSEGSSRCPFPASHQSTILSNSMTTSSAVQSISPTLFVRLVTPRTLAHQPLWPPVIFTGDFPAGVMVSPPVGVASIMTCDQLATYFLKMARASVPAGDGNDKKANGKNGVFAGKP